MTAAPPTHPKTCAMCLGLRDPKGFCPHCDLNKPCRATCQRCSNSRGYQGAGPKR